MSGLFKNAGAIRIAARCSQNERTMLGALEIVATSVRLTKDEEKKKEKLELLNSLIDFHGELFGFGAKEEAACFAYMLIGAQSITEAKSWLAIG